MNPPHYQDATVTLHAGDCLDVLRELPDASVDAVVTDPPYGLGFMGREWDDLPPGEPFARECLRVLKPGGHLLAFGGTRTFHRLACAVEDAGFEIRDSIAWLYGSGFPKSMDVSKAVEATLTTGGSHSKQKRRAAMGDEYAPSVADGTFRKVEASMDNVRTTPPAFEATTDEARQWAGWGTALKPAFEPIVVARKPLAGTVAANVLEHGTGALNIDACRVAWGAEGDKSSARKAKGYSEAAKKAVGKVAAAENASGFAGDVVGTDSSTGRFPANVLLDDSQAAELDRQAPDTGGSGKASGPSLREPTDASVAFGARRGLVGEPAFYGDKGGASRFFPTFRYVAKAPGAERPQVDGVAHATVKPLDLMRWLVRLVTRPGGHVLDLFAGSGTTGEAALLEGMTVDLIELEAAHLPLILQRVRKPLQPSMFGDWEGDVA